ncbi:hypothetical protein AB0B40_37935 [Streptomyces sp. NPDC042638]|uniref:hypothetical protein n=1 Tax=Streptomyces sp. NPDC042638 TaxID=3154333 RepID=UPI0033FAC332
MRAAADRVITLTYAIRNAYASTEDLTTAREATKVAHDDFVNNAARRLRPASTHSAFEQGTTRRSVASAAAATPAASSPSRTRPSCWTSGNWQRLVPSGIRRYEVIIRRQPAHSAAGAPPAHRLTHYTWTLPTRDSQPDTAFADLYREQMGPARRNGLASDTGCDVILVSGDGSVQLVQMESNAAPPPGSNGRGEPPKDWHQNEVSGVRE